MGICSYCNITCVDSAAPAVIHVVRSMVWEICDNYCSRSELSVRQKPRSHCLKLMRNSTGMMASGIVTSRYTSVWLHCTPHRCLHPPHEWSLSRHKTLILPRSQMAASEFPIDCTRELSMQCRYRRVFRLPRRRGLKPTLILAIKVSMEIFTSGVYVLTKSQYRKTLRIFSRSHRGIFDAA